MKHDGYNEKTGRPEFLSDNDESRFDRFFGRSPTMKIWQLLWEWGTIEGDKKDIARCAAISRPALYKVWPMFIDEEIIIPARMRKGKQLYKLNMKHKLAMSFINLMDEFLEHDTQRLIIMEEFKDKQYQKWKGDKQDGHTRKAVGNLRKDI